MTSHRTPPPGSLEQAARPTVRPAAAAAMLGIAPCTLWDWLKRLPDFPQPERYRLAGRNVTVWYVDDLQAWMAKQGDLAWRCNAPAAAVPLFHPEDLDAGRRGVWCAHLLKMSPSEVWPLGIDDYPGSDSNSAYLFEYVSQRVAQLRAGVPDPDPANAELTAYLRTLSHCEDVLAGRADPEIRGPRGFENRGKYRRGIYVPEEV